MKPETPPRLQILIARQRLETAALSYSEALRMRYAGTIAAAAYELGAAASAFGVAAGDAGGLR